MKIRPILFSLPMVQAILDGRKTQTRRVVKIAPPNFDIDNAHAWEQDEYINRCPYGKVGDVLWVRETWSHSFDYDNGGLDKTNFYHKASHAHFDPQPDKWKPSIHMPFEAARIFLEITNVRVERLMDISEQDAINEGVERKEHCGLASCTWYRNYMYKDVCFQFTYPTHSFQSLWQFINGSESLIANPWVWVLEFKRINKPTL